MVTILLTLQVYQCRRLVRCGLSEFGSTPVCYEGNERAKSRVVCCLISTIGADQGILEGGGSGKTKSGEGVRVPENAGPWAFSN